MVIDIKSENISTSKKIEIVVNENVQEEIKIEPNDHISLCLEELNNENIIVKVYKSDEEFDFIIELFHRIFLNTVSFVVLLLGWKSFIEFYSYLALEYVEYVFPSNRDITIKIYEDDAANLIVFSELENKKCDGLRKCDHISTNVKLYFLSLVSSIFLFPLAFLLIMLIEKLFYDGTPHDGAMTFAILILLVALLGTILSPIGVIVNFLDIRKNNKR